MSPSLPSLFASRRPSTNVKSSEVDHFTAGARFDCFFRGVGGVGVGDLTCLTLAVGSGWPFGAVGCVVGTGGTALQALAFGLGRVFAVVADIAAAAAFAVGFRVRPGATTGEDALVRAMTAKAPD